MQAKPFRENSRLHPADEWSKWKKAMVPGQPGNSSYREARTGSGSIWRNIRNAFPDGETRKCGIYEWQARKAHQPDRVVYVGCTCSDPKKRGALCQPGFSYTAEMDLTINI